MEDTVGKRELGDLFRSHSNRWEKSETKTRPTSTDQNTSVQGAIIQYFHQKFQRNAYATKNIFLEHGQEP